MLDPGRFPPTAAPDLATLRAQLQAALVAHPGLRRELRQALAGIDRQLGVASAPDGHEARRRGEVTDRSRQ